MSDHLGPSVDVRPLFGPQHAAFTAMLRGLAPEEWTRPTVCPGWSVQDVAAHVLGDHLGRLSRHRDAYTTPAPGGGEPFPAFLDRINEEWVAAARLRIGPALLIDLIEVAGDQIAAFWPTVDLAAPGARVTWAGPGPAPEWLDAARDFTEYWTHHAQIAEATGRPLPGDLDLVVDVFMRALPHTLRDVAAPAGTAVEVVAAPGSWTCVRGAEGWALSPATERPAARVELDPDTAWRLCTRGITPDEAAVRARVSGDERLTSTILTIVSIIWDPA